jgi:hypothetical protein
VAIYYSVIGLAAIFAAAVIPIIVMGSILEVSKLVAAWWLKANWHRAPFLLKSYMLVAVVVLMLITSMGIFGFLSKAHTEQAVPVGDNLASIQIIDERIAIEQEVIAQARQDIDVLNQQIERFTELGAVSRGVNVRNQQREERDALTQQILQAQENISALRLERAPFAASLRAIEAEVGPIKYIAKLIYGDATDANMLEQAVVWIIIVIVFVFDPLAVLLLLASQMSFKWAREERELRSEANAVIPVNDDTTKDSNVEHDSSNDVQPIDDPVVDEPQPDSKVEETVVEEPAVEVKEVAVDEPAVEPVQSVEVFDILPESPVDDDEDDSEVCETEKAAIQRWKAEHPGEYAKRQRHLLEVGIIDRLPWEDYMEDQEVSEEQSAAVEAARWAEEQLEESKKKDRDLDGTSSRPTNQKIPREMTGYVQNSEQTTETIWQKIKNLKNDVK